MEKITKDTNIMQAMEQNPMVSQIFAEYGIGCMGCMLAHAETIEDGLTGHGLTEEEIEQIINKINNS